MSILAAALVAGCGEDRPPAAPDDPGHAIFPPEPNPLEAFIALNQTLQTRNRSLYENVLSPDFSFSPTPEDSLRDEFADTGVYDDWTRAVEIGVLAPLFSDANTIRVELTPSIIINHNVFVRYRVAYALNVTDQAGAVVEYRGVAWFDIRNETGHWRLVRWDEIENVDGYESWGFLRGTLRPRLFRPGKG